MPKIDIVTPFLKYKSKKKNKPKRWHLHKFAAPFLSILKSMILIDTCFNFPYIRRSLASNDLSSLPEELFRNLRKLKRL